MIVTIVVQQCGACGGVVMFTPAHDAAAGMVFCCRNPKCAEHGIEYLIPTIKAYRYYRPPAEEVA